MNLNLILGAKAVLNAEIQNGLNNAIAVDPNQIIWSIDPTAAEIVSIAPSLVYQITGATCVVTALAVGSATITAKYSNGLQNFVSTVLVTVSTNDAAALVITQL